MTYEPWNSKIPCMYVFTELDNAIPLAVQQAMASSMGDITTASLKASHSSFLSQPQNDAKLIQCAVSEGLEKAVSIEKC
jgi:hypothetical protein